MSSEIVTNVTSTLFRMRQEHILLDCPHEHPFGHLAFPGWCGSLVLGSLRACGVQSSR
jgi:hypothetical protein